MDAFVGLVNELKHYQHDFVLSPTHINSLSQEEYGAWSTVKFDKPNKEKVPSDKYGIYCFIIRSKWSQLFPNGYVMYAGAAGIRSSNSYLRDRYTDYLNLQAMSSGEYRRQMRYLLKNWSAALYFCFCEVDDRRKLEGLERAINDSFLPPFSWSDLDGDLRAAKKAF